MAAKRRRLETKQLHLSSDENEPESSDYSDDADAADDDDDEDVLYVGSRNSLGNSHGRGTTTWTVSKNRFEGHFCDGMKEGKGCFYFSDGSSLSGVFKNDLLEGQGIYSYPDGSRMEGTYTEGELTGYCQEFDPEHRLVFAGNYKDNVRCGFVRTFDEFGGSVVGTVDEEGSLTCTLESRSIAYVYPDGVTAVVGAFSDGRMVSARPVRLKHPVADRLRVAASMGSARFGPVSYDESTAETISTDPLVADLYEHDRVFVRESDLPNAGEGLFARRDLQAGEVASFYNGIRITHEQVDKRDWALNGNTISLDDSIVIDVPREHSRLDKYCASLGHKANHSFEPNCEYASFHHPRFGSIKCVKTLVRVGQGEELTCNYGYDHKFANSDENDLPDWYTV